MPTVPRLTGPQVRPGVRSIPQESAASVAGPVGGAVLGTLGVVQELVRDAAERAERARLVSAENAWDQAETALLYDPAKGLLTTQREQAFEAPNTLPEAWNAERDRIAADLPPRVAEAFRERNAQRFAQAERTLLRHVDTQIGVVEREGYEVAVTNAQARYADAPAEDADAILEDALGTARAFFASQGMVRDADARVEEVARRFRLARVSALAETDPDAGRALLQGTDGLSGAERSRATKLLDEADLVRRSQAEEDRIMALGLATVEEARAEARKLTGRLRDEVGRRVEGRYADMRQDEQAAAQATLRSVQGRIERSGGDLSDVTVAERSALQDYGWWDDVVTLASARRTGQPLASDYATQVELAKLAADPAALARVVPEAYRAKLDNDDYLRLVQSVSMAQKGETTRTPMATQQLVNDHVFAAAQGMGLLPEAESPLEYSGEGRVGTGTLRMKRVDAKARFDALRRDVSLALAEARAAKGSNLTDPEIETVVQRTLATTAAAGTVERPGLFTRRFAAPPDVLPGEKATAYVARLVREGWSEAEADAAADRVRNMAEQATRSPTDRLREARETVRGMTWGAPLR